MCTEAMQVEYLAERYPGIETLSLWPMLRPIMSQASTGVMVTFSITTIHVSRRHG
uniref:Uncharacterized protein n=1 Tax=Anguilla anguilla TaxID=7936 RepID=A0A0E9RTD1_ANGAN